jgi:hypothetical protein
MFGPNNLAYRENAPSSPSENHTLKTGEATLEMWWPYQQRQTYRQAWLGYTKQQLTADNHSRFWSRTIPAQYPGDDILASSPNAPLSFAYNWCDSIEIHTDQAPIVGTIGGLANFRECKVTGRYKNRPYNICTDAFLILQQQQVAWPVVAYPDEGTLLRYVSIKPTPRVRYQTLPAMAALRVVTNAPIGMLGAPLGSTLSVPLPEVALEITQYGVLRDYIPISYIQSCFGFCNQNKFGLQWPLSQVDRGDVVFNSYEWLGEPYRQADGNFAVDQRFRFTWYPVAGSNGQYWWNHPLGTSPWVQAARDSRSFVNIATGTVDHTLLGVGLGDPTSLLFPPRNFTPMFNPVQP